MNAPLKPASGRFEAVLASARRTEPAKAKTTFEPCREGVLRHDGGRTTLLTPQQVSDLSSLYRREQKAAEAESERCYALWSALENARCEALDRCGAQSA